MTPLTGLSSAQGICGQSFEFGLLTSGRTRYLMTPTLTCPRVPDLAPAIGLLAASAGMQARRVSTDFTQQPGEFSSSWVLVTADPDFFAQPALSSVARLPKSRPDLKVWTDDYSALLPLIRW